MALLVAVFAGFLIWIALQAGYGAYIQARFARYNGPQAQFTESAFTPGDWGFLSTVPAIVGFAALLAADLMMGGRAALAWLGFIARGFASGVRAGVAGILVILPPVFIISELSAWLYNRVHFQHPDEHALLRAMKTSDLSLRIILIVAATILAPLFEELLFRAHLQNLLRLGLMYVCRRPVLVSAPGEAPVATEGAGHPPPVPQYASPQVRWEEPAGVWPAWVAIFIASIIFTMVHPMWMWPPLFVLSIGLGYVYQRTGNLWSSITMHCIFNSVSTAIYLWQVH